MSTVCLKVCRIELSKLIQNSFIALERKVFIKLLAFIASVLMEFICDIEKENWEPGDEALLKLA